MTAVAPDNKGQGPPPQYPPPPQPAYASPAGPHGPPPPPYGYGQPYAQPAAPGYMQSSSSNNVVIVGQPGYGAVNGGACAYSSYPQTIVCQHCSATVTTSTMFTVGTYAWLIALFILIVGLWLGCCLIPFCVDGCKDVIHTCPNCHCTVGRYSRL